LLFKKTFFILRINSRQLNKVKIVVQFLTKSNSNVDPKMLLRRVTYINCYAIKIFQIIDECIILQY